MKEFKKDEFRFSAGARLAAVQPEADGDEEDH